MRKASTAVLLPLLYYRRWFSKNLSMQNEYCGTTATTVLLPLVFVTSTALLSLVFVAHYKTSTDSAALSPLLFVMTLFPLDFPSSDWPLSSFPLICMLTIHSDPYLYVDAPLSPQGICCDERGKSAPLS